MSNDIAIRVEGLGKSFRLARDGRGYRTLREDLAQWPRRWWRSSSRTPAAERFWALRNVSFELRRGQVLGLIGRNGAGKSTLLKLLARVMAPTEGAADVYGRVGSLLEVGTGFHPELTGRENIFLSGAILGLRRAEVRRRFDEIVAFAGVEKFLDTACKHYSSGMYMRLGFAVAAHLDTEILLVDEVLAVGDAEFQRRCLNRMRTVAGDGRTILFVSHNMNAIRHFCSEALVVAAGRAEVWGSNVNGAIQAYLAGDGTAAAMWRPDAGCRPVASRWFTLESFRLMDANGATLDAPAPAEREVLVEIVGLVPEVHPALCIGFSVSTADEVELFWSYQTDAAEAVRPALAPGRNILRAILPVALLNEGRYRVDFLCGLHCMEWIVAPKSGGPAVYFEVAGVAGTSSFRLQRRPVPLAPVLPWRRVDPGVAVVPGSVSSSIVP